MAISVLDVRDTLTAPRVRVPARLVAATPDVSAPRRLPVSIVGAGLIAVLESIGLLAVALSSVNTALTRPVPGWIAAAGLFVLAAWVVLCAGSGAALVDGAGGALLMGVAYAETALVAVLLVVATVTPAFPATPLPVPVLGLLALTVPVGKLLLAGAPSSRAWIAAGPRVRENRRDPVQAHRLLATVTLGIIGISLGALAVLSPVPAGDAGLPGTVSDAVYHP
ncbi:MAG: hypothetical protein AVDCRST_MAG57-2049 [uncultured Blastococcus sp.]|uniref:Uncharacterized protein n=1 Tax=uncultured Blastococcus sp. TaxID=217144 RepID=A0A6J4IHK2_9ACTN|nr:MAG: hypothetical protein AVDCRST_MAG57-2049 [uncultured Blastococcus sp.]